MAKKDVKEVAVKEETMPVAIGEGAWGTEDLDSKDFLIPRLLVMQGLSELVTEGKAAMGEFRSSLDGKKLGDEKNPVEFLVFNSFKDWMISEDSEFTKTVPWTPENDNWEFEEIVDGVLVKRMKGLNFHALLISDIKAGEAFPYIVTFRSTSFTTGKKLATHIAKLKMFNQPSAAQVFALSATREKNDKGTFMVLNVVPVRKATDAEKEAAWQWYQVIKTAKNVKVHAEETGEVKKPVTSNQTSPIVGNVEY